VRKIRIICIGKTQEKFIKSGLDLYDKKVKRYCNLEWIIIKAANYTSGNIQQWQEHEAEKIGKLIQSRNMTIFCDESGHQMSSINMADKFTNWANKGYSGFDFFIGGAFGFSEEIKKKANYLLSLSPMTLTHQMIRLLLVEQIYRSFTIIRKEKYHH
jgi:23S rRNA (pseudouridine1915-N3)-methyltransferase